MVTHPSANRGPSYLTAVFLRELVLPTWHSQHSHSHSHSFSRHTNQKGSLFLCVFSRRKNQELGLILVIFLVKT